MPNNSGNYFQETQDETALPQVSVGVQIFQVGLLFSFITLGLIGNMVVCFVVQKTQQLKTIPNFLIINLSVSDLLRISLTLSVSSGVLIKRAWIADSLFCRINGFYTLVFLSSSLLCVTLISINRYFLVVKPNFSKKVFSKKNTILMVGCLWSLAILTALPPILGLGRYGFNPSRATCFIALGSSDSYTSILVIFLIATPFSITIWCYIKVYLAVHHSQARVSGNKRQQISATTQSVVKRGPGPTEIKVASTMLTLVGVYIVTWIPVSVLHFLRVAGIRNIPSYVDLGAALLISLSCVTNPWIYGFKNTHFRDKLRIILRMKTVVRPVERETASEHVH
ncbi:melanopsin-B-like [Actinia tenebrosa]|uniref:Melanopsin-B-like n=1 Tax=Actinia tenebrosa TaxID=6105 RepID=A0A6P8I5X1_ACTTE|nr:melanopsin-B-like [Actinia tenebrosa]